MRILRISIKITGFILSVPFITYGFLGVIKILELDQFIRTSMPLISSYQELPIALFLIVIGACLLYGLNALSNKIR